MSYCDRNTIYFNLKGNFLCVLFYAAFLNDLKDNNQTFKIKNIPLTNYMMNFYKLRILLLLFIIPLSTLYSQVTYEFCMTAKYGNTIVLDFKIHNNTSAPITNYNFVFNWSGVSNAVMWSGLEVIQNGDNGIVELQKTAWGASLPIGTTTYSITMEYEPGMFPPSSGTLNGNVINGITCYTPPAHENFKCERNFSDICAVKPGGPQGHEIRIGEGSVYAWNAPVQVYIPENRKSWAIAMAVSHSLFTNLMGFDALSINEYFATAIQESSAGCEGSKLIAPSWVTTTYPHHDTNRPIFCYDPSGAVAVGYFQQEMGGSWTELNTNYPCFIPQVNRDDFIADPNIGSNFEFQALVKAYHDYRNVAFWQYVKCWNPIDFLKKAQDPYAAVKIIGMAYNQGMNHISFEELFVSDRTQAMAAANLMDRISPASPGATNRLYAEQINRLTKVLDDNVAEINWADAAVFGVTDRAAHSFRGFYDAQFAWSDVEEYIKKIMPFYTAFNVDEADFIAAIKPVFDNINGGAPISFRYQMSQVIEAIVVYLPAFDPKKGLAEIYGGSGANGCFAPTARMEGINAKCGEDLALKVYFSGKAPYTFTYKRTDVSPEIVFPDIITSENPYTIDKVQEGTYALIAINDDVSAGEVVCSPIEVKHIGPVVAAKLTKYGAAPCLGTDAGVQVEITSSEPAPYILEYEIDGIGQPPLTINTDTHILMAAPAPLGTYKLTKISVAGCDSPLDEVLVLDAQNLVPQVDAAIIPFGGSICLGVNPGIHIEITSSDNYDEEYTVDYELDGVLQPSVKIDSSSETLIASPAATGTYRVINVIREGCDYAQDKTLVIGTAVIPTLDAEWIKYGEDICQGLRSGLQVDIQSNVPGPYTIEYEIDGVVQPKAIANSNLHTLVTAPAAVGEYKLIGIETTDCDFPLDKTIQIQDTQIPDTSAKLFKYGGIQCSGAGFGIRIEVQSTDSAPYVLEYEVDGVAQPLLVLNSDSEILIPEPAPIGVYQLKKISAGSCDFLLNEELIVDQNSLNPAVQARLIKTDPVSCISEGLIEVEIDSNDPGPFEIEYEIDGVLQPSVITSDKLFTLLTAPANGTYTLKNIKIGNCDFPQNNTLVVDDEKLTLSAKLIRSNRIACLSEAMIQVEINSNDAGPFEIEYEIDGVLQPAVITSDKLFTLLTSPANGTYTLTKISVKGCEFTMNETVVITDYFVPIANGRMSKYHISPCLGDAGIRVDIVSNIAGPYTVEYELDGVLQPKVTVQTDSFILMASPAAHGTYALKNITIENCDFPQNNTLVIDDDKLTLSAKLIYIDSPCSDKSAIHVEIKSNSNGPFAIEYEIDGVLQPVAVTSETLYTLLKAPAKGVYKLTKVSISGCDFSLNSTVVVNEPIVPSVKAKLGKYGGVACVKDPGIRIQIDSNIVGPYQIQYEVNGVIQPEVTTSVTLFTLTAAPAPLGTYRLIKITIADCDFPINETLVIDASDVAPTVKIEGNLNICRGNKTTLKAVSNLDTALKSFQWQRNGIDIPRADKQTYTTDQVGQYTVQVTNIMNCTALSPAVTVNYLKDCPGADYPKFFTPNGDGHNDRWHITNFEKFQKAEIQIFDRYGKLIIQLTQNSPGWDGTFNNVPLLATDYWFVMTYEEKNKPGVRLSIRGHFSLKR